MISFKDFFLETDEYVYHGTKESNIKAIKEKGLNQSKNNFHKNWHYARQWAPNKEGALLRVNTRNLPSRIEDPSGHVYTQGRTVKPKFIEIHREGKWKRILDESFWEPAMLNIHHEKAKGIEKRLSPHYSYTPNEEMAINDLMYRSHHYNRKLATNEKMTPEEQTHHNHILDAIKRHRTPTSFHVYTGITHHLSHLFPTDTIDFPSYKHTSLSKKISVGFADRHIIKIHIPKGAHGIYVGDAAKQGEGLESHEFILHPNAKIKLEKNPKQIEAYSNFGKSSRTRNYLLWHATLIHDGIKKI